MLSARGLKCHHSQDFVSKIHRPSLLILPQACRDVSCMAGGTSPGEQATHAPHKVCLPCNRAPPGPTVHGDHPSIKQTRGTYSAGCECHQHPCEKREVISRVHPVPNGREKERLYSWAEGGSFITHPGNHEKHGEPRGVSDRGQEAHTTISARPGSQLDSPRQ